MFCAGKQQIRLKWNITLVLSRCEIFYQIEHLIIIFVIVLGDNMSVTII